jgi:hypothetical protein
MQATHHPTISQRADLTWVVECVQCRTDVQSEVPIGIGMPLKDKETALRLCENHSRTLRMLAS